MNKNNKSLPLENKNGGSEKSFVAQAAIISISNFVVKIIGVLYKIPLTRILDESMGIFTAAYSIYAMLYMISTSGLPVAVSKLVSASNERGRQKEAEKIYRVSLISFGIIGFICTAFMMIFAVDIANWSKHYDSVTAMRVIAPTLFFVCIASAVRGYFHGFKKMTPTAISQFIEAFFKLTLGLGGALFAKSRGYSTAVQAAYSISGLTIGTMIGMFYLLISKQLSNKKKPVGTTDEADSYKQLTKKIALIAFPVTITCSALYLSQFLDTLVIKRCLIGSGLEESISERLYTAYTALAVSLAELLPSTLVYPIAISILPAVSGAYSVNDKKKAEDFIYSSIRISGIIALPCSFCLAALSRPCISLIYGADYGSGITMFNGNVVMPIDVASIGLSILALNIFFTSLVSTTTALLQACGKSLYPLYSVLTGVAFLICLEVTLTSIPQVGIYGAPISSIVCYLVAFVLNMLSLSKKQQIRLPYIKLFLKPAMCALLSGLSAFGVYMLVGNAFDVDRRIGAMIILLAAGLVAICVYVVSMLITKSITDTEVRLLPFGNRIADLLNKKGFLKKDDVK